MSEIRRSVCTAQLPTADMDMDMDMDMDVDTDSDTDTDMDSDMDMICAPPGCLLPTPLTPPVA